MYLLYASKSGREPTLVATFDSEQQLKAYAAWATLRRRPDGTADFEQGSALAGYQSWGMEETSSESEVAEDVLHNPSPSML
ncbi:MAG: hypothetical protein U0903_01975 [Planctomycetales bacterium]